MNYECIKPFFSSQKRKYVPGIRIGPEEYRSLDAGEQNNFIALENESFADQVADMIKREGELENEN